jgi:hypothetical protein
MSNLQMVLPSLVPAANDRGYEFGLLSLSDSGEPHYCGCTNRPHADSETLEFDELLSRAQ